MTKRKKNTLSPIPDRPSPDRTTPVPATRGAGDRRRRIGRKLAAAAILIAVSLALDLWGIRWGLPSIRHIRSYHPDEWRIIEAAAQIDPVNGQINPHFYNYGSFTIYSLWAAFNLAQAMGFANAHTGLNAGTFDPDNAARLYLIARLVTVLFSVGTVLLCWRLGSKLFGQKVGFLAALFLATAPLLVVHSHYAAVDIPATFWITAALWCCAKALGKAAWSRGDNPRQEAERWLLLGAASAGLAAGTKYNAGVALFPCLLTSAWVSADTLGNGSTNKPTVAAPKIAGQGASVDSRQTSAMGGLNQVKKTPRALRVMLDWLVLVVVAGAAFIFSTPGVVTETQVFRSDFLFEMQHSSTGHEYVFTDTAPGFIYHITHSLWQGAGPLLCILCLCAVICAVVRRSRADALLAAAALPYYLVIGGAQVKFIRYIIPLLPLLCTCAARFIIALMERSQSQNRKPVERGPDHPGTSPALAAGSRLQLAARLVIGAVLIGSILESIAYDGVLNAPDVRDLAADWMAANVTQGTTVGMIDTPWFDSPPLIFINAHMPAEMFREREATAEQTHAWPYRFVITGWNAAALESGKPEMFIISEWQMRYRLRIHQLDPDGTSTAAQAGRKAAAFMDDLRLHYSLAAAFRQEPKIGPLLFRWGFIQDDWIYPDPAIFIYRRR